MRTFSDECDYLIHLVRCAIHNDAPSEILDGAMFDSVYKCGMRHDVANIAYYSVEKLQTKPGTELLLKWERRRDRAVIREINQSYARDEILAEFERCGISSTEVQGTRVKQLYPCPEYRTMSDIDFMIPKTALKQAAKVLESLGYECEMIADVEVDGFREPNINIEVHTGFFAEGSKFYGKLETPFKDGVSGAIIADDRLLYLYNVLHIAKHYYIAGCGIRRILDLYLLNRHYADIAHSDDTESFFREVGIADFIRDASALAECWFGETETDPDASLADMAEIIKTSRVHGTAKRKTAQILEKQRGKSINPKVGYLLERLFPGKMTLKIRYPVLKKYPVLLPFFWFHRLFNAIGKNNRRTKAELQDLKDADVK